MSLSYRLTQDVSCTMQITSISAPVIQHYEKWYAVVHTKQMKCINKNCKLKMTGTVTLTWDINMHSPVTREV